MIKNKQKTAKILSNKLWR